MIRAEITLCFTAPAACGALALDTRALRIDAVVGADGAALAHTLHAPDPILGRRLAIIVPAGAESVRKPIYRALDSRTETKSLARELFARFRGNYHPIAQQVLTSLLK